MTQTHDIRRHRNGSIDIDSYRTGATALRRQAIRDAASLRKAFAGMLAVAGILSITVTLAAMPRPHTNLATSGVDLTFAAN